MIERNFHDSGRKRDIPVAEYPPDSDIRGIILFSVGFGGTREGYQYLARAWSALGFLVAVVEHVGSNLRVLQDLLGGSSTGVPLQGGRRGEPASPAGGPSVFVTRHHELARKVAEKVKEPQELLDRPYDLQSVTKSYLETHGPQTPLGLAGHSFGAYTICAASGCPILLPGHPRPKVTVKRPLRPFALLALSPQPPDQVLDSAGYVVLDFPTLFVTGTLDSGMPSGVSYNDRLQVYHHLPPSTRSMALIEGADHMSFAGVGLRARPVMETVRQITNRFWERQPQTLALLEGALTTYWNEEALCH